VALYLQNICFTTLCRTVRIYKNERKKIIVLFFFFFPLESSIYIMSTCEFSLKAIYDQMVIALKDLKTTVTLKPLKNRKTS
jgi:hypothetical protein